MCHRSRGCASIVIPAAVSFLVFVPIVRCGVENAVRQNNLGDMPSDEWIAKTGRCPQGCECARGLPEQECKIEVRCEYAQTFPKEYPKGIDCLSLLSFHLGNLSTVTKRDGLRAVPPSVRRLDMSGMEIGKLKAGWFEHLSELRVLSLEFNRLKVIPAKAFQGLAKLKLLRLTGNRNPPEEPELMKIQETAKNNIGDVHKDAFAGLSNLQVLTLQNNSITQLDNTIFRDLSKLKVLKLFDNPLARTLNKTDVLFDPIRKYCYQLDISNLGPKSDSGDSLELYWEENGKYLSDEWFEGAPPAEIKQDASEL